VPRKPTPEAGPSELVLPRAEIDAALDLQIVKGQAISEFAIQSEADLDDALAEFHSWDDYNRALLERSFSSIVEWNDYTQAVPIRMSVPKSLEQKVKEFRVDVRACIRKLTSLKERLDLYEPHQPNEENARHASAPDGPIFVVHGHAGEARETVARFLERLGTRTVILHEEPNSGQTIIEKLERHGSAAGFAVILLTGDDEGREQNDGELRPRSRQNVVLELGFFIGTLGRGHTAILYEPGVELPSDLDGLVYIDLDAQGAWRLKLAKELKAAGVSVDLNKAM
jgi:predicted nucleotide-binding protein